MNPSAFEFPDFYPVTDVHGRTRVSVPKSDGTGSVHGRRASRRTSRKSKARDPISCNDDVNPSQGKSKKGNVLGGQRHKHEKMSNKQLLIDTEKDFKRYNGYLKKKIDAKAKLAAHRQSFKFSDD